MTARVRLRFGIANRRATLAVLAVAHFVLSAGVPLPTAAPVVVKKPADRPYPCAERPCGCLTYEQCWAGDCCCFTMAEKLAWAKRNSITPPASALAYRSPPAEPECPHCPAKKSCCATAPPAEQSTDTRWVVGLFVRKCRGEAFAGIGLLPVAVPPEPPFTPTPEVPAVETIPLTTHLPTARATPPDAPPPKPI